VAIFEYLGTTVTNQNPMHVDIESKLIRALLNTIRSRIRFHSRSASENLSIEEHTTIILPDVLYGS
jgi:trimethylamine:corrinoid methyltransferase-like protein